MKKKKYNPMFEIIEVDKNSSEVQLECIKDTLKMANKYAISSEVVWSAIMYAKNNPDKKIYEIMRYAFNEWVK